MMWKVLISAPYMQPEIGRFRAIFESNGIELVIPHVKERLSESELLELMDEIDGVICGDDRFTETVLKASPMLKVISKWGTGIDSIDKEACKRLGIEIRNSPNAFSEPVADTVMGYILCFLRQLPDMDREMRESGWHKKQCRAMNECILGVIGVGNVGKAVVRRALGFGMKLLGNDIVEMPKGFLAETGIEMIERDELLKEADFISINCDLNPTSYHLIGKSELELMKNTAYIVNTARGPIIDEHSLINALEGGYIAGAALDVFEEEPLAEDSPLREMDNVFLAPHNANSSPAAWERVHENSIKNLLDVLLKEVK